MILNKVYFWLNILYLFSLRLWYEIGTIKRNKIHHKTTIKQITELIIGLWKKIQLNIIIEIPKIIIDQGWHQKGFNSQKAFEDFVFINKYPN